VPDDRTIVVERFRDELGDWRVVIHSPFGAQVHAPWALAISARMRERFGVDVQAMHGDDGLVLRLPDVELEDGAAPDVADLVVLEADDVDAMVTEQIGGSALFASRFRECAARALLLPRRRPGARSPLWQQRQRAAQLLEVASRYPSFPIVLETGARGAAGRLRRAGLESLMRDLAARRVRIVEVETASPSPFARSLLFGYVAQFLYEGDSPLAERRAAALSLDPTLLAELLGRGEGAALRDLLDPEALTRTERELQRLTDERLARHGEDVADLLRVLGPLSTAEVAERSQQPGAVGGWLVELEASRRVIRVRIAARSGGPPSRTPGDCRMRSAPPCPSGCPRSSSSPVPDPLGDLLSRHARTRGPFTVAEAATRFGLGTAVAAAALQRLVGSGRLVEGELRPGGQGLELCDAEVLRVLRRRSLATLRSQVEPVAAEDLARFLPQWQGVGGTLRGVDGLLRVVEQLAGAVLPASALETLVLPGRLAGWSPGLLDELTTAGEVLWCGHGQLPGDDGWVSLHLADTAPLTLPPPSDLELTDLHRGVLDALAGGGAYFFRSLADAAGSTDDQAMTTALWDLVWAGRITGDSLAPLRSRLAGGRTTHRTSRSGRAPAATRGGRAGPGACRRGWGVAPCPREPAPDHCGPVVAAARHRS
jgi:ATP-dependent Lhr-like helicase